MDALGLGREPDAYRHAVLCERPPGDFAFTLARQWCYDHADQVRLGALAGSSDAAIAAVARKLLHEERYHVEHADHWFRRLVRAGDDPRGRLAAALERVLPEALWLFEPLPDEAALVASGILEVGTRDLLGRWLEVVIAWLREADLTDVLPEDVDPVACTVAPDRFATPGGRHGRHSADFTEDVSAGDDRAVPRPPGGALVSADSADPVDLAVVTAAVRTVPDPELPPVTIGMLGMVHDVRVEASGAVTVELLPTYAGCPATDLIRADVEDAVHVVPGVAGVTVRFRYDPPWTPDRIDADGRAALAAFGIAPPVPTAASVAPDGRPTLPLLVEPPAAARPCPYCGSQATDRESAFGPTPCRDIRFCRSCQQPFEAFRS